jgi:cobalt/nickel transport system permease protein
MHIPDNFLSTPVWAAFDAISAPAVVLLARSAKRELDDARIPLLGVMGAFIFAAQMINFPVGAGTSGHLVGGALLACVMGAAPAAVVMTAIIATQAFVFQDGGVLALGANVFNMAIAGVLAGYLPYKLWGATRWRTPAIFLGGFLSVLVSGSLALSELLISGVPMPGPTVPISFGFFCVNGLLEGAITVVVIQAIEKLNPRWAPRRDPAGGRVMVALAGAALLLGVAGFMLASTNPDGIQRLGLQLGLGSKTNYHAPLADYATPFLNSPWLRRALAGLAGLTIVFGACAVLGKMITRQRSA